MTGTRKGMTGTRKGMTGTGHQTTANPDFASGQIRISRRRLPAFLPIKIRTNPDVCKLHPDKSGFCIRTNSAFTEEIARISPAFTSGQIRIFVNCIRTNPDFASGQIRISRRRLPGFLPRKIRTNPDVCKLHPDESGFRIRTNPDFTERIARISHHKHPDKSGCL